MQILYLIHNTKEDGSTISFLTLIKGIYLRNNTTVHIVVPKKEQISPFFLKEVEKLKVQIYQIYLCQSILISPRFFYHYPIFWIKKYSLPIRKWYSKYRLNKLIKTINPDIIHTNTGVLHEGFEVSKELNIPHVWHLREYQDLDFNLQIYPSYYSFCNKLKQSHVICITKGILNHFNLQNYSKAKVIYNGVFSEKNYSYNRNKSNYFLCASRISPEKNINQVIEVFSIFKKSYPNYKLIIAGSGNPSYIDQLKQLCKNLGCENNIVFLGFVKDISTYMCKAKALIVASYNEGFGRMTAEACFCGCIVIGKNTAGTKEILENTGGMLFNNSPELEKAMETVVNLSNNEYEKIALSAQEKAIRSYSIENYVNQVSKFYQQITSK